MLGLDIDKIMQPITDMNVELVGLLREMNQKLDDVVSELRILNTKEQ